MSLFKSSFFNRIYLGYVVVILITSFAIGILVASEVENNAAKEINQTLTDQVHFLSAIASPALSNNQQESLQAMVMTLAENIPTRFTLIDVNGKVLADSTKLPIYMDNHGNRKEVLQSKTNDLGHAVRYSKTLNHSMKYLAKAIKSNNNIIGFARVSMPLTLIDKKLHTIRMFIFVGALFAAFIGLIIGWYFARYFSKPILNITKSAMAIAQGDYQRRIFVEHDDEIGSLAHAFNNMAKESSKRLEQLSSDKNKLATILSGMVEGVVAVDQQQSIIHINDAAAKLLDVSNVTSIGASVWSCIAIDEINKILLKVLNEQGVHRERIYISTNTIVEVYCASISDAQGQMGAILVLNDVSELYRLERVRQDFVVNASHELKTPITVIRGAVETILDDADMPAEISQRFLQKAADQTERLSNIVNDLMAISRLENTVENKGEVDSERLSLTTLLDKSLLVFTPIAIEKNIQLIWQKPQQTFNFFGDEFGLGQAFDNLIDNAIKYTPDGGIITVALTNIEDKLQLTVSDNGIGISLDEQQRIFERFYRIDKARSRDLGGTGLGLAIVKHIIEQHQGSITVNSTLNKGTTFTVTLPAV